MILQALRSHSLRALQSRTVVAAQASVTRWCQRIVAGNDAATLPLRVCVHTYLHRAHFGQLGLQRLAVAIYMVGTGHDVVGAQVCADVVEL